MKALYIWAPCLAVYLLLTGLQLISNVQIVWMNPLRGLAAAAAGIALFFYFFLRK